MVSISRRVRCADQNRVCLAIATCLAICSSFASAQDKPPEKKDLPKVLMAVPLVVSPGVAAKITLRGQKLDTASEVTLAGEGAPKAELKKKEKAAPPNGLNANEVGDSFVDIEFTLPEAFEAKEVQLTVTNPDGSSQPYSLLILPASSVVAESEPNEAFRKCNKLATGQTIVGSIHQQRDVDVFEIDAAADQSLVIEAIAARRGSAVDPILVLYDAAGQVLAQTDDQLENRDAILRYKSSTAGKLFVALLDAHDRGSSGHPYLLQLRTE